MKKAIALIPICCLLFFSACKKDENETIEEMVEQAAPTSPNYSPFRVGAYWVYETTRYDTILNTQMVQGQDTVRVIGDTTILGQDYFIVDEKRLFSNQRDTTFRAYIDGCLEHVDGAPLCFGSMLDTLGVVEHQNVGTQYSIYVPQIAPFTVPAGTFQDVNQFLTDFYTETTPVKFKRGWRIYAEGIGLISQRYFFATPDFFWQRDLVAYSL